MPNLTPISMLTPEPPSPRAVIFCDGSCPKNPGPMGIGFSLVTDDGSPDVNVGYRLGEGTNNQAEYNALIAALRYALRQGTLRVQIFSDSLLMVNHVNHTWECKDGTLKKLLDEVHGLSAMFVEFNLTHVHREDNGKADILSKNPTDDESILPALPTEIQLGNGNRRRRTLPRLQAALIRWWWKTRRCQNEYRLARIFGMTESVLGKIGSGDTYKDITEGDLAISH